MARAGDKLTDYVTANWYNWQTRQAGRFSGVVGPELLTQNQYVTVYNPGSTKYNAWEAVRLGNAKINYALPLADGVHQELAFYASPLDEDDPHNIVILQDILEGEEGASAIALLSGSSWLRTTTTPVSGKSKLWVGENDQLEFSNKGRIDVRKCYQLGSSSSSSQGIGVGPTEGQMLAPLFLGPAQGFVPAGTPTLGMGVGPFSPLGLLSSPSPASSSSAEFLCLVTIGGVSAEGIIDLRLSGLNLQYTTDGQNWTTWHTGTDCNTGAAAGLAAPTSILVATDTTLAAPYDFILVDASSSSITVYLDELVKSSGTIKLAAVSGPNTLTIRPLNGKLIDGSSSKVVSIVNTAVQVEYAAGAWRIK